MVERARMRRRTATRPVWLVLVVTLLLSVVPTVTARPGNAAIMQQPPPELQPVRIVVLVDESGSLSTEDVARERDATRVIVQGEPSPRSTVSVVGFASADASGQAPVDPVCPPTVLDTPQKHQSLADCIGEIRGRAKAEGDGTDHVTALRTALSYLNAPDAASQPKMIFLLTDGKLDVSSSPAYGANPDDRNAAARQQIPGLLNELNQAGISVWPLGFGQADRGQLEAFATGAAQDRCGVKTPRPSATVITGSADLMRAISAASRSARCASVSDPVIGELPEGGSVDLAVEVPAIASEGSILTYKRDPRVTVSYHDPQGTVVPTNGTRDGSRFELTGQGTEAEALHIVHPVPGRWTVHLSAPPGVPATDVAAVAIFQGAIRAAISVNPPTPQPGATVQVSMRVTGSRSAIADPAQLRGLTFTAELSGEGFSPVQPVELGGPDGSGQYQGPLTVPDSATGRLDFVGSVTGIGVSGDRRPYPTKISRGAAGLTAVLTLDGVDSDVVIGKTLSGTANVTNSTGQPRTLRLEVTDQSPGAVVSAEPAQLRVPAAGNATLTFTVRFDPATAPGPNQARLRLVDESDDTLVGELLFARNIVPEPSMFARLWRLWVLLAVALIAGITAAVWRVRRGRAERDVRGVRVELRRHGQPLGDPVKAHRNGEEFRFAVRQGDGMDIGLTTGNGGDRYTVRRGPAGLTILGPSGEPIELTAGGVLDLGDGVELVVRDRPTATHRTKPKARKRSGDATPRSRRRLDYPPDDPYSNVAAGDRPGPEDDPYANA